MSAKAFLFFLGGASKFAQSRNQAKVAREQAARERVVAGRDADLFRRRQQALLASDRAKRGASGVTGGSGLLVDDATMLEILLGESAILEGGLIRSRRLIQGGNATEAAGLGSLLGGAVSASTLLTEDAPFGEEDSQIIGERQSNPGGSGGV